MNSYEYIEEVKRANGLDTDYKVSKLFGWSRNKVSQYKSGQSMDNEAARQVAQVLGVPLMQIIADMEVQRAKDEPTKKAWKMLSKLSKQSGRVTANVLITLPFLSVLVQSVYIMLNKAGKNDRLFRCEPLHA